MRINSMQVEVFRRAMESKQDDLKSLITERSNLLTLVVDKSSSKSLPTLPSELIAEVFASLYLMENKANVDSEKTTLQRLLEDSNLSDDWKHLIRGVIPAVFAGDGKELRVPYSVDEKTTPKPR